MSNYGNGIDWNAGGTSGTVKFGDDRNLLVVFYNKAVENTAKSINAGRRITENQIYVKIQHPGESLNIIDRPVKDEDKYKFRDRWKNFLMNRQQIPEGTPIDLLFPNNPAFAENLRGAGVHTVEQCAGLSAIAIDSIGRGGQECVNRAKQYLENAKKGADFHMWKKKEEEWSQKFKIQEQQIKDLATRLEALLQRSTNPQQHSLNPPFIPGYDAQSERINANHPTTEIAQKRVPQPITQPILTEDLEIEAIPAEPTFPANLIGDISK